MSDDFRKVVAADVLVEGRSMPSPPLTPAQLRHSIELAKAFFVAHEEAGRVHRDATGREISFCYQPASSESLDCYFYNQGDAVTLFASATSSPSANSGADEIPDGAYEEFSAYDGNGDYAAYNFTITPATAGPNGVCTGCLQNIPLYIFYEPSGQSYFSGNFTIQSAIAPPTPQGTGASCQVVMADSDLTNVYSHSSNGYGGISYTPSVLAFLVSGPCPVATGTSATVIDSMYVTQAARFSKYTVPSAMPVPLFAGRQAEVRVFVVTAPSSKPLASPPIVRIVVGGQQLATLSPTSPNPFPSSLPYTMSKTDELNVTHSYNALIPAAMMSPGMLPVQAVVLDANGNETSASQTLEVNVMNIAPLLVQIVPLVIGPNTGLTTNLGTNLVTQFWPFPSASYVAHTALPVTLQATESAAPNDLTILAALESKRRSEKLTG